MTACTNNGGKARRVVTAALVGVLSVGAVPAIALATGGEISTLALDENVIAGADVIYDEGEPGQVFYDNGKPQGLVPEAIDPDGDGATYAPIDVTQASADSVSGGYYYFYVKVGESGTFDTDVDTTGAVKIKTEKGWVRLKGNWQYSMPSTPGTYAVVAGQYNGAGGWTLVGRADTFSIAKFSLDEAKLIDGRDITDTEFNYTGEANSNTVGSIEKRVGVAVGDHILTRGDDYTVAVYKKNSDTPMRDNEWVIPGQDYVVKIWGKGNYGESKQFDFKLGKLVLDDATIVTNVYTAAPGANPRFTGVVKSINGVAASAFDTNVMKDVNFTVDFANPDEHYQAKKGEYTYKITVKESSDTAAYVEGEATVKVVYANTAATFDFSGCGTKGADGTYYVDYSLDKPQIFDLSHIVVAPAGTEFTTTVTDDEGNVVDMAGKTLLDQSGTYYVKASAYEWKNGSLTAGSDVVKVVVSYGSVDADTGVFMTYRGENVERRAEDTYDGTDLSKNMAFTVKAGDKTLAQGTDYEVTFEKQADDGTRTAVEEIVDAGTYIVTVQGKTYDGKAEFTFVVSPVKPDEAKVVWDVATADGGGYLAYTGDVLTPSFRFFDVKGNEIDVPEGSYVVDKYEIYSDGDWTEAELKEVGTYHAFLETAEGVENFDLDIVSDLFDVTDKKVFLDVPMNEWYSQGVYDAAKLGYMNGEGNGATFGPMRELTRAEAACVLFNMAGGDDMYADATVPGYDVENKVYDTDYTDVEGNEFFAKAVAWCKATGIINGYADGTFGVSRNVTNEEFACMLANYAKAKNEYKAVDADEVLAAYPDASVVSDWAKDSVAWCVSEGIMGGGANISPAGSILRMRAATMAVNAQPEKLGDLVIDVTPTNPKPGVPGYGM